VSIQRLPGRRYLLDTLRDFCYNNTVVKKTGARSKKGRGKTKKRKTGVIFWFAFALIMVALFAYNWRTITQSIANTHLIDHIMGKTPAAEQSSPTSQPQKAPPAKSREPGKDNAQPASQTAPQVPVPKTYNVYFVKIDSDGDIVRTPVKRDSSPSNAPLSAALKNLLKGPTKTETAAGIISLIPDGTKLISCNVKGDTAFVNFDDTFQFNTHGADGYMGSLREVVWTATDFPNVKKVQILINGAKVDFLGENIRIDVPLSRIML
jgi:spore germination protein GerM